MKPRRPLTARLVLLFGAGLAVLNFPLLKLWLAEGTLAGSALALFVIWGVLIALLALLMERRDRE